MASLNAFSVAESGGTIAWKTDVSGQYQRPEMQARAHRATTHTIGDTDRERGGEGGSGKKIRRRGGTSQNCGGSCFLQAHAYFFSVQKIGPTALAECVLNPNERANQDRGGVKFNSNTLGTKFSGG